MLTLENFACRYEGSSFSPQSFQLPSGELRRVSGPSGSGKSSLLRAIANLVLNTGTIHWDGKTPAEIGYVMWRRHVHFHTQRAEFPVRTVEENLRRPFQFSERSFALERAESFLTSVGLGPQVLQSDVRALSGGERQRVHLVRALMLKPDVLLFDEPTTGLDESNVLKAELLIKDFVAGGGAALLVTHDDAQAERLCTDHSETIVLS